jgi:hypothetical protein
VITGPLAMDNGQACLLDQSMDLLFWVYTVSPAMGCATCKPPCHIVS